MAAEVYSMSAVMWSSSHASWTAVSAIPFPDVLTPQVEADVLGLDFSDGFSVVSSLLVVVVDEELVDEAKDE